MKRIKLILVACIFFALIVAIIAPSQASAQSTGMYFESVKGKVYNKAFPAAGAKVTLYSWDGKKPGSEYSSLTTGSDGTFTFRNVAFDPSNPVSYIVKADRDGNVAYALVLYYPPGASADEPAEVQYINLDIASDVPAMRGQATITVWSTVGAGLPVGENLARVLGANLMLYSVDSTTGNLTQVSFSTKPTTGSDGQYTFSALPYGKYYLRAEKNNKYGDQYFWVTQQENALNVISNIDVPKTTPTPNIVPTANASASGSGGFLGMPGFEAIVALLALVGAVLYLRRE